MKKAWIVARHEFRVTVKRIWFLVATLLPILLAGAGFATQIFAVRTVEKTQHELRERKLGVVDRWGGFPFHKLEFLRVPGRQAAVQDNLHPERREVDVPRFDQGFEKRDAVFDRDVEDIRLQELEHNDSHLLIASVGESRHEAEPVFIVQFLSRHSLDHVQQLLRDEAFEGPKGLPLEHRTGGLLLAGFAFAENQLAYFLKQGRGWVRQFSLQGVRAQEVRQRG